MAPNWILNLSYSVFTCISSAAIGQPLKRALDLVDRLAKLSMQLITPASEGRIGQPEEGLGVFTKWSMLADEMVSLHRAKTHWGLWGVRHIWANRRLMSCVHELPIIERGASIRGLDVVIWSGSALFGLGWKKSKRADLSQVNQGETLYNIKGYVKTPTICYCNLQVIWITEADGVVKWTE